MKPMNLFGICVLSAVALTLTGCGKKKGNPPPHANGNILQQPWQNPNWQNQQVNQPFQCQPGIIQLRNAFGSAQCYHGVTDLGQACAQAGGYIAQGGLCRRERQIQGTLSGTFRNRYGHYAANIPLRANLYPGEAFKLYGNVDAVTNEARDWNAQLLQQGTVVGSASSSGYLSSSGNNLVIVSMGAGQPMSGNIYPQNQFPQNQYPQVQCIQAPCPGNVWPQQNQWQQPSMYSMAVPTQFSLQLTFEGKLRVKLYGSAISCEDGRGNSYPCQ